MFIFHPTDNSLLRSKHWDAKMWKVLFILALNFELRGEGRETTTNNNNPVRMDMYRTLWVQSKDLARAGGSHRKTSHLREQVHPKMSVNPCDWSRKGPPGGLKGELKTPV